MVYGVEAFIYQVSLQPKKNPPHICTGEYPLFRHGRTRRWILGFENTSGTWRFDFLHYIIYIQGICKDPVGADRGQGFFACSLSTN